MTEVDVLIPTWWELSTVPAGGAAVLCIVVAHLRTGPRGVHLELALPEDWSVGDGLEVHLDCDISTAQQQYK